MVTDEFAHQVLAREARLGRGHAPLDVRRYLDQPIAGRTTCEGVLEHLREGVPDVLSGVVLNHLQRGFDIVRMYIGGVVRDRAAVGTNGQLGARLVLHPCSQLFGQRHFGEDIADDKVARVSVLVGRETVDAPSGRSRQRHA